MGEHANEVASAAIKLLKDKNFNVRYKTAWAMGCMGNPEAVEPLIDALNDTDKNVRTAAANSLKQLTEEDFGESREKWKEWFDKKKG